jgi:hypothetical protein
MNSVVILFICDLDELVNDILLTINAEWVERSSHDIPETSLVEGDEHDEEEENNPNKMKVLGENHKLKEEMKDLAKEFQVLHRNMDLIMEQNKKVMQQNAELISLLEASGIQGSHVP